MQNVIHHFVDILIITTQAKHTPRIHYSNDCLWRYRNMKNRRKVSRMLQSRICADFIKVLAGVPETLPKLWYLFWGVGSYIISDGFTYVK